MSSLELEAYKRILDDCAERRLFDLSSLQMTPLLVWQLELADSQQTSAKQQRMMKQKEAVHP